MATSSKTVVLVCTVMPNIVPAVEAACAAVADRVSITFSSSPNDDAYKATIGDAEVLFADPGLVAGDIDSGVAASVKWLQSTFAGVDAFFAPDGSPRGRSDYALTRMGEGMEDCMAEWGLLGILSLHRKLPAMIQAQRSGVWAHEASGVYDPLSSMQLGMLGCGRLGTAVAQAASGGLGMRCVGFRRSPTSPSPPFSDVTADVVSVLASSQFVINLLPSTASTHHLLSYDVLSQARDRRGADRPAPAFLNAGRGDVIAEDVLVKALDDGLLSFAFLDVFETEPLPADSPLWRHPRVVITPHVASNSLPMQCAVVFGRNLAKILDSGPDAAELEYKVDWARGY